jgi:hypothetical protein
MPIKIIQAIWTPIKTKIGWKMVRSLFIMVDPSDSVSENYSTPQIIEK